MSIQHLEDLTPKRRAIARALYSHGVVIWEGLPDAIIDELKSAGYKVKRVKTKNK
jgi:hypothetical protein